MEPASTASQDATVSTAALPDETSTPDTPTGVTGVSSVLSTVTTPTATMAVVSTSPAHPAVDVEKHQRGWRLALARVFAWPVGSVGALLVGCLLLAGPLAACAGFVWALITDGRALAAAIGIVNTRQYNQLSQLSQLSGSFSMFDIASRVMFASVAYFALLYALIVLMGGLLGRSWARLFLLSGLLFTAVALLTYLAGLLLLTMPAQAWGAPPVAMAALALYSLLDASILASVLCDLHAQEAPPVKNERPSYSKRITGKR